jgi:hypothetical protein
MVYGLGGSWDAISVRGEIFRARQDWSPGQSIVPHNEYRVFPGSKTAEAWLLTTDFFLVPKLRMGWCRIPVYPLCLHRHVMGWLLPLQTSWRDVFELCLSTRQPCRNGDTGRAAGNYVQQTFVWQRSVLRGTWNTVQGIEMFKHIQCQPEYYIMR